jgi:hypothetical protein
LLVKFAVQEVVQILVKAGVISSLTGSLVRTAEDLKLAVSDVKLYRQFQGDIVAPSNVSNIQVVQPPA